MPRRRSISPRATRTQTWHEITQVAALAPIALGVLLMLTALTGAVVWGNAEQQLVTGGVYVLFGFAFANAVQRQWRLASGWLFLSASVWLADVTPVQGIRIGAAAVIALSVAMLVREFFRRRRQYLDSQIH